MSLPVCRLSPLQWMNSIRRKRQNLIRQWKLNEWCWVWSFDNSKLFAVYVYILRHAWQWCIHLLESFSRLFGSSRLKNAEKHYFWDYLSIRIYILSYIKISIISKKIEWDSFEHVLQFKFLTFNISHSNILSIEMINLTFHPHF